MDLLGIPGTRHSIGLDVHQATIVVAVMDSAGKLVMESILETKAATILQFFAGLRGTSWVTFEGPPGCTICSTHGKSEIVLNPGARSQLVHPVRSSLEEALSPLGGSIDTA